jgi:hypothetical protein
VQVQGDRGCFVHLVDIVPTRSHIKGPWNQAYDLDALRTIEVKADYLRRAIAGGWWVSFAHDRARPEWPVAGAAGHRPQRVRRE